MEFFDVYNNCPIGSIFYIGYGDNLSEYHLIGKGKKSFYNELRLTFKKMSYKPVFCVVDEYDCESQDEWLLFLRPIYIGI